MVRVTFELPQVGRRRLVCLGVLCGTGTALWIYGAVQQSAPSLMWLHVVTGVAVPFGVGWVTLLLMERRISKDMVRTRWRPQAERKVREDLMS
jgi:heme O synthase-like polyprenyltransferase